MKNFKDLKTFENKLKTELCFNDYMKIGGKLFKIFEYGGGDMFHMDFDYVYFYNKKSKTMLYIKYICPSYCWKNGVKILTKPYKFISFETEENPYLWREDTL